MSRAERPRPHLLAMVRAVRASRDRGAPARISVLRPANPPNPLPHLSTILSSFSVHVDSVPFTSASDSLRAPFPAWELGRSVARVEAVLRVA